MAGFRCNIERCSRWALVQRRVYRADDGETKVVSVCAGHAAGIDACKSFTLKNTRGRWNCTKDEPKESSDEQKDSAGDDGSADTGSLSL